MATTETIAPGLQLITPETTHDEEQHALLTFTSLGDTVGDETRFAPNGNITKDGMALADRYEIPILVSNRPFTGRGSRFNRHERQILRYADDVAGMHAETIDRAMGGLGISRITMFAESAGATHSLSVAKAQILPITQIGSYDPIGWVNLHLVSGFGRFLKYTYHQEGRFNKNHPEETAEPDWYSPSKLQKTAGIAQMLGRQTVDISKYGPVWATKTALDNTRAIRDQQPEVGMYVAIPEFSLSIPEDLVDSDEWLRLLADGTIGRAAEFKVEKLAGRSHASINNMANRREFLNKTLSLRPAA